VVVLARPCGASHAPLRPDNTPSSLLKGAYSATLMAQPLANAVLICEPKCVDVDDHDGGSFSRDVSCA
jgi:hypothetical protein